MKGLNFEDPIVLQLAERLVSQLVTYRDKKYLAGIPEEAIADIQVLQVLLRKCAESGQAEDSRWSPIILVFFSNPTFIGEKLSSDMEIKLMEKLKSEDIKTLPDEALNVAAITVLTKRAKSYADYESILTIANRGKPHSSYFPDVHSAFLSNIEPMNPAVQLLAKNIYADLENNETDVRQLELQYRFACRVLSDKDRVFNLLAKLTIPPKRVEYQHVLFDAIGNLVRIGITPAELKYVRSKLASLLLRRIFDDAVEHFARNHPDVAVPRVSQAKFWDGYIRPGGDFKSCAISLLKK